MSTASSIVSAIQLPDPSESGLFDAPPRPRQRGYRFLDSNYTYVFPVAWKLYEWCFSSFQFGRRDSSVYEIAVLVDPLSETAQKWSSLIEVISMNVLILH